MRIRSIVPRRPVAALLLTATLAGGAGCTTVRGLWPGGGATTPTPTDPVALRASVVDEAGGRDRLTRDRDALRARRDRAWEAVRAGQRPSGYGPADALALGVLEEAIDAATPWTVRPAPGRAGLAELARRHWWYLFVAPSAWAHGPLAIDRHDAPGFYAAMMHAFDRALAEPIDPAAPLDAEAYLGLHQQVTLGVFDRTSGRPAPQGFTATPIGYAIAPLHDPGRVQVEALAQSLAELKAEGLAAWNPDLQRERSADPVPAWLAPVLERVADINPHSKPAHLVYSRGRDRHGFAAWLRGWNDYQPDEARKWIAQWLAAYAGEVGAGGRTGGAAYLELLAAAEPGESALASLRPICRLVRRLQVSHVFAAGGVRLDTRLLLNRLLLAQGLPPVVIEDVAIFAGGVPLDAIARTVFHGQRRFQTLVRELASREPAAPGAGAIATAPAIR